ncbi:phosphatidate cytidylyltransferase [Bartonella sp. TP]|uniref:phosphatidate cytidylyltransferase n=1 Tax=Bartonella sp. TP TaxID=3057550 RepID=UPI0025B0C412|nr:phosphatidate cytidylyltransferase [Bartonella sp. TP]WJW79875.1 phosphatidate cytidylyltransferase [Bartonella sp. TP]
MHNLLLRLVTGFILAFFAGLLTYFGGVWFNLFIILLCGLVYFEYQTIANTYYSLLLKSCAWFFYAIVAILILANISIYVVLQLIAFLSVLTGILAYYDSFFIAVRKKISIENIFWPFFGFLYTVLPLLCLSYLRTTVVFGDVIVFYLFAAVWGSDIGGYVGGKLIGGVKLAPSISPNKTWAGAFFGGFFAIIFVGLLGIFIKKLSFTFIWPALLLASFAQLGDLFESMIKRRFSVKDSGSILPGHGGVLDRVDGLLFAVVAWSVLLLFTKDLMELF